MKFLSIIRPLNISIALVASFIIGSVIIDIDVKSFICICIVLSSYIAAGNILNDLCDIEIDRINKPARVLVKHDINRWYIIILIIFLFIVGSITATMLSTLSYNIALYIALPGIILYELIFKKLPFIGNLIISTLVGSVFLYTEAALTGEIDFTWPIMILALLLNLIREIIKDMEDIDGDNSHNLKTLPITLGTIKTIWVIRLISLIFIIASFFSSYLSTSRYFLLLIFFTIHLPLLYINIGLKDNISSEECARFSNILKLLIINGVLIILIFR